MKQWVMAGLVALGLVFCLAPMDAEAKRLGGGKSAGMQRSTVPDKPAQPAQNAQQPAATPNAATPAAAAAPGAAAAAASKRSWMGPIAGLAAGLGLAALFSHLGWGEGLANFVMLALLVVVAVVAMRFLMRRFMGGGTSQPRLAAATASAGAARVVAPPQFVDERPGMQRTATAPVVTIGSALQDRQDASSAVLPAGFDTEGFQRLAKMLFIRMQAANDSADLNDLRNFTTPELFASLRLDLQERGAAPQVTDVVEVDAQLIDFEQAPERQVVSVRFTGRVKEDAAGGATPFDEVWHLVQPADGSRAWAIAGIQQRPQ